MAMLLNFEIPADAFAFAPKQTIKGGRWKDRLTARKSAEWGRKKTQERVAGARNTIPRFEEVQSEDEELIRPDDHPSKRAKTDEHGGFGHGGQLKAPYPSNRSNQPQKPPPKSTNGDVISSLFTYNPKSTVVHEESKADDEQTIEPSNAPLVDELANFTNLGLSSTLASHLLKKLELKAPTAIQRKAIEQLCLNDTDAFIQAETGSGKTLAYLLPILERITQLSKRMKDAGEAFKRENGLFAIILAPTRELSKQIESVLDGLLSCCRWIVGGIVIGGEKKKSEKARLRKGLNILVATPGRLADHLDNTEQLDVSKVRWLVLDEGDRLMELGFEKDIQKIVSVLNLRGRKALGKPISGLPERRTTVLCSATLKSDVEQLRSIALKNAVSISVDAKDTDEQAGPGDHKFSAPAQLKQSYAVVPAKQRLVTLVALLKQTFRRKGSVMKCIVFMSCADSVDFHFEILSRPIGDESKTKNSDEASDVHSVPRSTQSRSDKIPQGNTIPEARTQGMATACSTAETPVQLFRLHGSLQQSTRTSTLKAFTACTGPAVLVCTDVASRGLDLPDIDLVVEYDPPFAKEDHLHRIGRTARAGKDGRAMIFLMPGGEEGYVDILKEGRPHRLTRHDADELLKKGFSATTGVVANRDWEDRATDMQLDVERWALESPKHLEQARRAFQSHVRAYATHTAAERSIFDMKELHLGHLAKAFALRDSPGSIRVPGLRPGKDATSKTKAARASKAASGGKRPRNNNDDDADIPEMTDERAAKKKMYDQTDGYTKVHTLGGASEFNLG